MSSAPSYRANAVWAGVFFIIASAFLFVGEALHGPAVTDPDVLTEAAAAERAGWGLASAVVLGAVAVAVLFVELPDLLASALIAPLAVQEVVLALHLILNGFDRAALDRLAQRRPAAYAAVDA
ncbi:MAG: hypothetical protein R2731_05910 [Nocardioides sp.]